MSISPYIHVRAVLIIAAAALSLAIGPCGPLPGGELSGDVVGDPVTDWSFANEIPRCAVEVRPSSPHSVTVNCMSWQKQLYVSCSSCSGKRWSGYTIENSNGRVRMGSHVYPVSLHRVEDAAELDAVWQARAAKLRDEDPGPRPEDWWTFRLESR